MSFVQNLKLMRQLAVKLGGARRDRTDDLLRARQALSQLSYGPLTCLFSVWLCCTFCSVGHVCIYTLPPSQKPRLANRKKSCVKILSNFSKGGHFSGIKAEPTDV